MSEEAKTEKSSSEYLNVGYNIKIKQFGNEGQKKHKQQEKTI